MSEKSENQKNEQEGSEPVIEFAREEDCPGIVEVDRDRRIQRFEEHQIPIGEFNETRRVEELKIRFENGVAERGGEGLILVLKIFNRVVGYIEIEKNIEMEKETGAGDGTVFIDTVSILREYQGKGLALGLIKRAVEEAKMVYNPKKIQASVIWENLPAVKFWTDENKAGFKQIKGPLPRKNKNGEPKLWDGKPSHSIVVEKDLEAGY